MPQETLMKKLASLVRRRSQPGGIHFGEKAARWAETRFAPELRPVAAHVAELLCEQLGVELAELEPGSNFTTDLKMTELEPVEVVMALEEDLGFGIPEEDCERCGSISALVDYLYRRLQETSEKRQSK